jgi:hypothetical protein
MWQSYRTRHPDDKWLFAEQEFFDALWTELEPFRDAYPHKDQLVRVAINIGMLGEEKALVDTHGRLSGLGVERAGTYSGGSPQGMLSTAFNSLGPTSVQVHSPECWALNAELEHRPSRGPARPRSVKRHPPGSRPAKLGRVVLEDCLHPFLHPGAGIRMSRLAPLDQQSGGRKT